MIPMPRLAFVWVETKADGVLCQPSISGQTTQADVGAAVLSRQDRSRSRARFDVHYPWAGATHFRASLAEPYFAKARSHNLR